MKLKLNCREVTHLLLKGEDKSLSWHERLRVNMHMRICATCPRFARQLVVMRNAFAELRRAQDD